MEKLFLLAANSFNITAKDIGAPTSTANVGQILGNVAQILMGIMGGLAIVFILIGSIQLAYSRGNAKNVEEARETILYACVGLGFSVAAYAIVTFLLAYVK